MLPTPHGLHCHPDNLGTKRFTWSGVHTVTVERYRSWIVHYAWTGDTHTWYMWRTNTTQQPRPDISSERRHDMLSDARQCARGVVDWLLADES